MKKLTIIFSLFLIGATLSFAQVNSNYDGPKPEVYSGAKSFVFMYTPFQSNFNPVYVGSASGINPATGNFTNISLSGVGFQYYISNDFAIVLGANFGTMSDEETEVRGNPPNVQTILYEGSYTTFGLSVDANYHLKSLYGISPYVGLNVSFASFSASEDQTFTGPLNQVDNYEASGSGLGAGLNFGFDWYFTEGISLGGKYTLGFRSFSAPEATEKRGNVSTTSEGPSSSSIGTGSASVMLNVHF